MTETSNPRPTSERVVEIADLGQLIATAEVETSPETHGTAHVSFHAAAGHLPVGTRSRLVDAVLALPEVERSDQLQATVPIGDAESLMRLGERMHDMHVHAAGCTAIVDADISGPCAGQKM
jgi:hypothetical protein